MFLLIQEMAREEMRFNASLHSNMFLLIPFGGLRIDIGIISLHSNMFLLIPDDPKGDVE